MSVHLLILCGGQGSRLGHVRKGDLRLGNMRLLDRVIERLRPVEEPILLATGPDAPHGARPGPALPDPPGLAGPMAGIMAGALHLRDRAAPKDVLVTVAVDTPFLPRDYVTRLVAASGPHPAFASYAGNPYPTNAAWPMPVLADLLALLSAGTLPDSPRRVLAGAEAQAVDWADGQALDPFANLNTVSDLIALSRRARIGDE